MDFEALVQAIQTLNAEDAFRPRLGADQWRQVAPFFTRHEIRAGDLLVKQGELDRAMYLLGQGSMQVFATGGPPGSNRIAILRAGSIIGEPGLFSDGPRSAHTTVSSPSGTLRSQSRAMPGMTMLSTATASHGACGSRMNRPARTMPTRTARRRWT